MIRYYVYENAYWEGPEEEMPAGATEVPKRRNLMDKWDGSKWVYDKAAHQSEYIGDINREFCRISKFYNLDSLTIAPILADLTAYSKSLREYVKNVQTGIPAPYPQCPATLTDISFYNL